MQGTGLLRVCFRVCCVFLFSFSFFACGCLVILALFVEKTLFSIELLCTLVKSHLTISVWVYFWILYSDLSTLILRTLDFSNFLVSLNIGWVFLVFSFTFKAVLAILVLFLFHINFRITLLLCAKKYHCLGFWLGVH